MSFATLRFLAAALLAGVFLPAAAAQTVLYVDADASGSEDGTSWANAYQELDEALEAASAGTQIWVAEGVYRPTDDPDRTETFRLKSGVAVLGGFDGTETSADDRTPDPDEGGTVLSGDIGVAGDASDNVYHVVSALGVDATAVLDGFLVTGGNANGDVPNDRGGGLTNSDLSSTPDGNGYPTLRNVSFAENTAIFGGGAYLLVAPAAITMEDVEFKENRAFGQGGGIFSGAAILADGIEFEENVADQRGGGAYISPFGGLASVFRDVEFDSNVAGSDDNPGEPGRGAGFYTQNDPTLTFIDVEFERNRAVGNFGDGAGFLVQGGTVNVVNAVFTGNTARAGAAFMTRNVGGAGATLTVTNAVFAGNQGAESTWGIIDLNESTDATLSQITMSGNDGFKAMRFGLDSNVELHNLIVWDNDTDGTPILVEQTGGSIDVDHAIIEGGFPGGEAVLSDDPLFYTAPDDGPDDEWGTDDDDYGDLRLRPESPAQGFGDLDLVPQDVADLDGDDVTTELLPFDLDGDARVQDGSVELGAYEGVNSPIDAAPGAAPTGLALSATRPNPTRSAAVARLTLEAAGPVEVALYDVVGRRVQTLQAGPLAAGEHTLALDASGLPAGVYVLRAATASGSAVQRLTVVR